jgi:hypothetical protein
MPQTPVITSLLPSPLGTHSYDRLCPVSPLNGLLIHELADPTYWAAICDALNDEIVMIDTGPRGLVPPHRGGGEFPHGRAL